MNAKVTERLKIKFATFSAEDFSRSQVGSIGTGFFLLAAAGLAIWIAGAVARYSTAAAAAARDVVNISRDAEFGSANYSLGSSLALSKAVGQAAGTEASVNEAGKSFASLLLGFSNSDFGKVRHDWQVLQSALAGVSEKIDLAASFSNALTAQMLPLARLQKKMESVRVSSRGAEAISRLAGYSETGFGLATAPRAEYEIRVAAYELSGSELRNDWAPIERAVSAQAKASVAGTISRDELQSILAGAREAKAGAEKALSGSIGSNIATIISWAGLLLFVAGLLLIARVTKTVADDFSRRFKRATDQFRGGEDAVERIGLGLKSILVGKMEVKRPLLGDEFAAIYQLMGELVERIRDSINDIQGAAGISGRVGDDLGQILEGLNSASKIGQSLQDALAVFVREVLKADIDARAAAFAASQASDRAGDSEQVIRDAISRIESMRDGMQEASKNIKRLGERGQEIGEAIDLFSQMSEQIGVLSLNAALEAERAGDHGKGFRIVSNEIRVLARRSEESVETLDKLVRGLQADARIATEAVDRATSQIVSGSHIGVVANALTGASAAILVTIAALTKSISKGSGRLRDAANKVQVEMGRSADLTDQSISKVEDVVSIAHDSRNHAISAASRFQQVEG